MHAYEIKVTKTCVCTQVLLREEETKMALDDADIKAVELDAQKALLEQVVILFYYPKLCTFSIRNYYVSMRKPYNS